MTTILPFNQRTFSDTAGFHQNKTSPEFPVIVDIFDLLPHFFPYNFKMNLFYFQVIAPQFKHFQKLRDFIEMKLPPGFPVKVDIPVSKHITFQIKTKIYLILHEQLTYFQNLC